MLALVWVIRIPPAFQSARQTIASKKLLSREIRMGVAGPIHIGDSYVLLTGYLRAGDFFEGIEVQQTENGRRFCKSSRTIMEFPPSLTVDIDTRILKWEKAAPQDQDVAKDLLSRLHITAKWKTGLEVRDVKNIRRNYYRPSTEDWMAREDSKKLSALGLAIPDPGEQGLWIIRLQIEDDKVPLTDSLIIAVENDGKLVGRLSARL